MIAFDGTYSGADLVLVYSRQSGLTSVLSGCV
jgi:hypothetical protein